MEMSDSLTYVLSFLLVYLLFYKSVVIFNTEQFSQTPALELINIH